MDLRAGDATVTVSGVLSSHVFAGPPSYESIAKGDAPEKAFILKLAQQTCADDGEFIDGTTMFDRVHVSSYSPALLSALKAAVGRHVTVTGEAFGAHTGHHHAPLVLFARKVTRK